MTTRPARPATSDPSPTIGQQEAPALSPWLKAVLSGLILFHVAAVFWAPLAFAGRGSPLADGVFAYLRPYAAAMYLDHGYSFFAPEVGPGSIVRYKVEFDDGREPVEGQFPHLASQQPRLLYHRHFMMADALHNSFVPATAPPEPTPPPTTATREEQELYRVQKRLYDRDLANWRHARRQYEALKNSLAEHLRTEHGGSRVTITRVAHQIPFPDQFRYIRKPLDTPESFVELPETPRAEESR
ncbi:MAG: hypothetical protein MUF06_14290 [Pirellulaceae bacterium]|jgi:hypothetical protein|nr:hypothetical protein [Pirellulaceae bacterium]